MRVPLLLCITLCVTLLLASCHLAASEEINLDLPMQGVVDLNPDNFFDYVGKEKGVIVWLYSGLDARVPPMVYRIGKAFERNEEVQARAVLAKLNFDKHTAFVKDKLKLRTPGIIYFDPSSTAYRNFVGLMQPRYIARFINEVVPNSNFVTPDSMSYLRELTPSDVSAVVEKNEAFLFVLLYRGGCDSCHHRRNVMEDLAYAFRGDEDVVVGYVDMAKKGSEALLERIDGRQYEGQTHDIFAFRAKGNATAAARLTAQLDHFFLEDLVDKINGMTGNGRTTSGTYKIKYAIDGEMAALVASLMKEERADAKQKLVEKVRVLAAERVNTMPVLPRVREVTVNYYVQVAEHIVAKGSDFPIQELNRVADLIEQDQLSSKNTDKAYLRVCVLRSILNIIWDEEKRASGANIPEEEDGHDHSHSHGHGHGHDHHHHHDADDL